MITDKPYGSPLEKYFESDIDFDILFPEQLRVVSARHWTPLDVAKKSADYLATHAGARVLDIGSGSGKFCFVAAYYHPEVSFYGVEQRGYLVDFCNNLKKKLGMGNVHFVQANVKDFDISAYDHFYFYNSFYENLPGTQKIDHRVSYSEQLYDYYNRSLFKKFKSLPAGTKLVTYHSLGSEVPPGFEVERTEYNEFLKFWVKK